MTEDHKVPGSIPGFGTEHPAACPFCLALHCCHTTEKSHWHFFSSGIYEVTLLLIPIVLNSDPYDHHNGSDKFTMFYSVPLSFYVACLCFFGYYIIYFHCEVIVISSSFDSTPACFPSVTGGEGGGCLLLRGV